MQKIIFIAVVFLIVSGCAGLRKSSEKGRIKTSGTSALSFEKLIGQNITNKSFFIQKAEISVSGSDIDEKFIAAIRYNTGGKYLISVRTRTGIEAGRIYITPDTLLANDRINKILYYSNPDYFNVRYGISYSLMPLLFGDFVGEFTEKEEGLNCSEGVAGIEKVIKGKKIYYDADCQTDKIIKVEQEGSFSNLVASLEYSEFIKVDDIDLPSKISFYYVTTGLRIIIKIDKVERPWEGTINFIPGAGYEKKELK